MADSYLSGERAERYQKMLRAGDVQGVRKMKFGRIIYNARLLKYPECSQGEVAELAKVTRVQWNRYENGQDLPRPPKIPDIAKALLIPAAVLFCAAGYGVPEEHVRRDAWRAHRRLDAALEYTSSEEEFLVYMRMAWMEEELQMICTLEGESKLPEKIVYTPAKAEMLARLFRHLSMPERVQLAMELVQSSEHHVVEEIAGDLGKFYEDCRASLDECFIRSWPVTERDFIL